MSATAQNFSYTYGKKHAQTKEQVLTNEKLKEIKESMNKYLSNKK